MRVSVPKGVTAVSVAGVEYKADRKGCVEVPDSAWQALVEGHGCALADSTLAADPGPADDGAPAPAQG